MVDHLLKISIRNPKHQKDVDAEACVKPLPQAPGEVVSNITPTPPPQPNSEPKK